MRIAKAEILPERDGVGWETFRMEISRTFSAEKTVLGDISFRAFLTRAET